MGPHYRLTDTANCFHLLVGHFIWALAIVRPVRTMKGINVLLLLQFLVYINIILVGQQLWFLMGTAAMRSSRGLTILTLLPPVSFFTPPLRPVLFEPDLIDRPEIHRAVPGQDAQYSAACRPPSVGRRLWIRLHDSWDWRSHNSSPLFINVGVAVLRLSCELWLIKSLLFSMQDYFNLLEFWKTRPYTRH
jgi:hypothetical protein